MQEYLSLCIKYISPFNTELKCVHTASVHGFYETFTDKRPSKKYENQCPLSCKRKHTHWRIFTLTGDLRGPRLQLEILTARVTQEETLSMATCLICTHRTYSFGRQLLNSFTEINKRIK